ncbi:RNA polymerase-associated protein RapA [Rubripirellula obstinata]|uniref:RNA polymerase-associated protein RapA n=1 Tax=Rubripirellula obstinata TaxID=406547 RepID=A0A5B1CLG3_9BACT|nr:DEAD/DEAH box helicase [Rubripirellula obstinata]KAA1261376.1 RNA polymerase-associated protein RapA [Rubripirellula obstinata]
MAATTTADRKSKSKKGHKKKTNVFHERLGSLTYYQACQLLGDDGAKLIQEGGRSFEVQSDRDVYLGGDLFRVRVEDAELESGLAIATITLVSGRKKQLQANCDQCQLPCEHVGAAFEFLLTAKSELGLAMPPDESVPLENLTAGELHVRAIAEREKRGNEESMIVRSSDNDRPWTDYVVTSKQSGRTYRVALRGMETGDSFCTCPDFRTNHLRTCKHIINVQSKVKKRFSKKQIEKPYRRNRISVAVDYGTTRGIRFHLPHKNDSVIEEICGDVDGQVLTDAKQVLSRIEALEQAGRQVQIYPDAEAFVGQQLVRDRVREECNKIRKNPSSHELRKGLLNATLLPYQLDGIAFAAGAGRSILADDMGLGKTIQGIGVAELLSQLADIKRVLVVCPASLKSQWRSEIAKFSGRSSQLILGSGAERAEQYHGDAFFTICNYEQVLRDVTAIETVPWDLIILDEGQRIKNWESKTSQLVRSLESPFRLVLSGTPLENRLGELYTVTKFVDDQLLGPAYQFFNRHHVVDDRGKTQAYHRLDELRGKLSGVLLRRTRAEIADQLPERTDEIVRIEATQEQLDIQDANVARAAQIASKKFMTEMDRLVLMSCLSNARMACDSTYLLDQDAREYSSKLDRLSDLLEGLIEDPTRKIVIFSEWRRMLDRIETRLDALGAEFVRLDGQVPQKKRSSLVSRFQNDPDCRVICMTNAGSTGLNLQAANTVINVDLPWNPAVLEQRIARAHRMGQKNPVHVYKLVTVGPGNHSTLEERLLDTLASKQELADASLNIDSEIDEVAMVSGMEDLKRRLEVILAPKAAAIDESQQRRVEEETLRLADRKEKVSQASGTLISAALSLAGQLVGGTQANEPDEAKVSKLQERLSECVDRDEAGRPQLKITLADDNGLRDLAKTLATLLGD